MVVGTEGSGKEGWSLHETARKFLMKVWACEHRTFRSLLPCLELGAEERSGTRSKKWQHLTSFQNQSFPV